MSAIWLGAGASGAIAEGVAAGLVVGVAVGADAAIVVTEDALAIDVGAGVVVGAAGVAIGELADATAVSARVGVARTVADDEPFP